MFEWYRQMMGIRLVVGFCILILVSVVMSCKELKYAMFSTRASATVFKVYEERQTERDQRRHGGEKAYVAMYRWKDPTQTKDDNGEETDGERSDGIREWGASSYKPGDVVQIDYLKYDSRLAGQVQWVWPGVLVGSVLLGVVMTAPIWWEAFELGKKKPAGSSRRR